jgi:hypothetical protein
MGFEPAPNDRSMRPGRIAVATLLIALLSVPTAGAQGIRSLGMGGVSTPGSAGGNPAFGALPDGGDPFSLPLPLGALNFLLRPELDPYSDQFDLLSVFDQVNNLGTFLLNPARSPDEVIVSIAEEGGVAKVAIELVGGAPLQITSGEPVSYGQDFDLPIGFGFGPLSIGIRPYVLAGGSLTPLTGFDELFDQGASSGEVEGAMEVEGGVSLDIAFATALPIPPTDAFPGQVFLGVRAKPFIGLLRGDGDGSFTVTTFENEDGETEYGYTYEADLFFAAVGQGGLGYGAYGDLGVAITVPTGDGSLTAGIGVNDLGIGIWQGMELSVSGDSQGESTQTDPTPASRTYLMEGFGLNANVAYDFDTTLLGVPDLGKLIVAADGAWDDGEISAHMGVEGGFDAGIVRLLARAGAGYDNGLVAGIGAGAQVVGVGLDAAVHTNRSPQTAHQAVGAAVGLAFGF